MSTNLVWQLVKKSDYKTLPKSLKFIIEEKFKFPCVIGLEDYGYFRGLHDAGIEGADEVLELITKYESIELGIE